MPHCLSPPGLPCRVCHVPQLLSWPPVWGGTRLHVSATAVSDPFPHLEPPVRLHLRLDIAQAESGSIKPRDKWWWRCRPLGKRWEGRGWANGRHTHGWEDITKKSSPRWPSLIVGGSSSMLLGFLQYLYVCIYILLSSICVLRTCAFSTKYLTMVSTSHYVYSCLCLRSVVLMYIQWLHVWIDQA